MDCSPSGASVHGISQTRILEWVAISFSRGSSWPRLRTRISCIGRWILYHFATCIVKKKKKKAMLWKSCLHSLPPLPHHPLIPQSTTDCCPCHFIETAKAPWQVLKGRAIANSNVLTLLTPAPPAASNTVVHVTMLPFFFVWVSSLLTLLLPLWWVFLSFTKYIFMPSL